MEDRNYRQSVWAKRVTRRTALRGAAIGGLGMAAFSVISCGEETATPTATVAPTSVPTGTATTAPPTTTATTVPTGTATTTVTATTTPPVTETPVVKRQGKISYRGHGAEPPGYDPHQQINSNSLVAASFPYSRIARFQSGAEDDRLAFNLLPEGDVADSWESADLQNWTIRLRQNVKWHNRAPANGRGLTSADIKWNLDRFLSEGLGKDPFVQRIESYTTPDDYTVVFKLKAPFAPFASLLANPIGMWLVNREVVEQDGDANKNMLGTGPFMAESWQTGTGLLTKANPDYFIEGFPAVAELDDLLIPDAKTYVQQFKDGALDVLRITSVEDKDSIVGSNPDAVLRVVNTVDDEWFFFSPSYYPWGANQPPFNDERVRQAVSMAIDRDGMIDAFYGGKGNWCAGYMFAYFGDWYIDPKNDAANFGENAKVFQFDLTTAKQLMSAAGLADGVEGDIPLHFTTAYGTGFQSHVEANQAFIAEIGINTTLVPEEYGQYISNTFLGNFEGIAFGLPPVYTEVGDILQGGFHPSSSRNHSKIDDPALTEMIDKQFQIADRAERVNAVHDIVRYAAGKCYYPSTVMGETFYLSHPWVHDWSTWYGYGAGTESFLKIKTDKA